MKKLLFVCLSWMLGIAQVSAQDATSPYLQLLLMGTGLHIDDWGAKNNTNLLTLENAIAANSIIPVTVSTTLSIFQTDAAILTFTGTLSAAVTLTLPSITRVFVINNQTTGAPLSLQASAGVPLAIPQYGSTFQTHVYFTDGQNVFDASQSNVLIAAAITAVVANYLPLAGGTMTGAIAMGNFGVTGLASPVNPGDAATKAYVDAAIANVAAVPVGTVGFFALSSCPSGWVYASGSGGTVNMQGRVARGIDVAGTTDPAGTRTPGNLQGFMLEDHTHSYSQGTIAQASAAGGFNVVNVVSTQSTTIPNSGTHGVETRMVNTALMPCQKT